MATETRTTTDREELPTGSDGAVSDERNLGRLEGQMSVLLLNVAEHGRQAREDYRALDAKIDSLNAKIDSVNAALSARIDRHFYWMLGLCVAIILTVVGSAIGLAIRLG